MESLAVVVIFTVIQVTLIVVSDKYLIFDFYTNLALFICVLLSVMLIGSLVIYYSIPFNKEAESE